MLKIMSAGKGGFGMNLTVWFLYFILYSFLGWAYESTLCSITGKKLVNRGFLTGPLCPVYGFGALLILLVFDDPKAGLVPLFLSSMVLTSTVEYLTSVILERLFHTRWWDYSGRPFNIHGRVFLLGALVFATFSVLLVRVLHPVMAEAIGRIPSYFQAVSASAILALFLSDLFLTVRHLLLLNGRLAAVREDLERHVREGRLRVEDLKLMLQEKIEDTEIYSDKVKALFQKGRFMNRRLFNAFPQMRPLKESEIFNKLKNTYVENRKKIDEKITKFRDS